jgi:UDP-N-acetylglucosamine 4,6-dehydratase/5-epimerase
MTIETSTEAQARAFFKDKRLLITGGTGSFGRHILSRLKEYGPAEIVVFSRDEKKQYDMRLAHANSSCVRFILGDVRDAKKVRDVMGGIDIVYQAAALKQVPNCEKFVMEAVQTNILGAANVIDAALDARVPIAIAVSTDKAVKPVNAMGMTKALQEKVVISANGAPNNRGTRLACVRYGNVMHSRGSVIPYFTRLLKQGKPCPVTDPRMTRFLLTLGDAVDLVIHATLHAAGGEVFVKKAPSVSLSDLAAVLWEKHGQAPLQVDTIGLLPGEKMHEILISEEESIRTRDAGSYFIVESQHAPDSQQEPWEYSSRDQVAPSGVIRELLDRSEREIGVDLLGDAYFTV